MIKKQGRLASDRQIKKVLHKGAARSGSFFKVKALKNPRLKTGSRVAVITSKKISNKAVVRNKVKRRVKAVFMKEIPKIDGYDFVVFPHRRAEDADFAKLTEDAKKCLRELVSFS